MDEYTIIFYRMDNDKCPVKEFLNSLDTKMQAKVLRMIALLKKHGNDLREPYSKHLGDGIFELRTSQGSNISRVLYFFMVDQTIVLTNGFIKKTQKIPQGEIIKAKRYREDCLKRKEHL